MTGRSSDLFEFLDYQLNLGDQKVASGKLSELKTSTLPSSVKTAQGISATYSLLNTVSLAPGSSKTYKLYLWIRSDACEGDECKNTVMKKGFEGQVIVYMSM